ncbi:transcription elongation factor Spt5 [Candidatus Pacearchaeota archaeon CG1_02_32_132]|nr:MAG: transcription elongation factor Spt5 [Candidatus Pacearchaeota archaeon CG1_02_32_132]
MIFIIKVTTNKEGKALEMISDRVNKKTLDVFAVVKPHGLRGYIIIEAADRDSVEEAVYNLPYVKGILPRMISYDEVKNMLQPEVEDFNIEIGDIVEMIADTFKNEKGKVTRIDKKKGEVVVSLLGAAVPIPVTVKMDNVRVIRRDKDEESGESDSFEEKYEN